MEHKDGLELKFSLKGCMFSGFVVVTNGDIFFTVGHSFPETITPGLYYAEHKTDLTPLCIRKYKGYLQSDGTTREDSLCGIAVYPDGYLIVITTNGAIMKLDQAGNLKEMIKGPKPGSFPINNVAVTASGSIVVDVSHDEGTLLQELSYNDTTKKWDLRILAGKRIYRYEDWGGGYKVIKEEIRATDVFLATGGDSIAFAVCKDSSILVGLYGGLYRLDGEMLKPVVLFEEFGVISEEFGVISIAVDVNDNAVICAANNSVPGNHIRNIHKIAFEGGKPTVSAVSSLYMSNDTRSVAISPEGHVMVNVYAIDESGVDAAAIMELFPVYWDPDSGGPNPLFSHGPFHFPDQRVSLTTAGLRDIPRARRDAMLTMLILAYKAKLAHSNGREVTNLDNGFLALGFMPELPRELWYAIIGFYPRPLAGARPPRVQNEGVWLSELFERQRGIAAQALELQDKKIAAQDEKIAAQVEKIAAQEKELAALKTKPQRAMNEK